ncbi:MAG: NADH-quinone oxidoreductase subunit J family protein [Thermoanaerobaculia bacterium]
MERLFFDAAAVVAILFAALMVVNRNPVKSVLALVVSFFFLAVCYVLLAAPFIAAIQIIVYAGAILVLFLFVLMLLNIPQEVAGTERRPIQHLLGGAAILLFTTILVALLSARGAAGIAPAGPADASGQISPVARAVYAEHLLSFEALSVLLLAALVGAFALVEKEKRP